MLGSVIPFTPELADGVSEYCENHSETLPQSIDQHWDWTTRKWMDADMMSSKLQGQWMIWMAQWIAPKRVLEVGTFTGFSALAWYEGTKATNAEIVTLDIRGEVLHYTRENFKKLGVDDRITIMEGPASKSLREVEGEFELIFLDADKKNYQDYIDTILNRKLLSKNGIILVDNGEPHALSYSMHGPILHEQRTDKYVVVFARGLTIGNEYNPHIPKISRPFWEDNGETLRVLCKSLVDDKRIDVLLLPMFDGVTQIKWKAGEFEK